MNHLTREQAAELFENKLAFITEVDWEGLYIVVDGVQYLLKVDWKQDD